MYCIVSFQPLVGDLTYRPTDLPGMSCHSQWNIVHRPLVTLSALSLSLSLSLYWSSTAYSIFLPLAVQKKTFSLFQISFWCSLVFLSSECSVYLATLSSLNLFTACVQASSIFFLDGCISFQLSWAAVTSDVRQLTPVCLSSHIPVYSHNFFASTVI